MTKPPPHQQTRKMRRTRDSPGSSGSTGSSAATSALSGFVWYETHGNAAAAWEVIYGKGEDTTAKGHNSGGSSRGVSTAHQYNRMILSSLVGGTDDNKKQKRQSAAQSSKPGSALLAQLEAFQPDSSRINSLTARKRKRNELIMAYNRALIMYTQGQFQASAALCQEHLSPFMNKDAVPSNGTTLPLEIAKVAARMAMVWLENLLALQRGRTVSDSDGKSEPKEDEKEDSSPSVTPDDILTWLVEGLAGLEHKSAEFKFLRSLYKGRADLAARSAATGTHEEARIRSARKELKTAMEVFQHRLRNSANSGSNASGSNANNNAGNSTDNASVDVSSVDSKEAATKENNMEQSSSSLSSAQNQQPHPSSSFSQQQSQQQPIVLQKLNQSALNLKANLEQLKGNVKKSLILCQEARLVDDYNLASSYYNAMHANNLAVVYQTSHKRHLALHVLSKALQQLDENKSKGVNHSTPLFSSDGTATPAYPSLYTVWNAAMVAIQARNYRASYECLVHCLKSSPRESSLFDHGLTWLRLAEACMGMHLEQQQEASAGNAEEEGEEEELYLTSPIVANGELKGLVIRQSPPLDTSIVSLPLVGSAEDLELISNQPLRRARFALERVLFLKKDTNHDTLQSARLSLAYICLLSRNHERALELSQAVLADDEVAASTVDTSSSTMSLGDRMRVRRCATARMYAAEASCCGRGTAAEAMQFLVGRHPPQQQDANGFLDRLASDLAGVTIETAAVSGIGKRRLARAQALVRSSASAVTAALGHNMTAAKQLAMSAQAMEDAAYSQANGGGGVMMTSTDVGGSGTNAAAATATTLSSSSSYGLPRSSSAARRALIYCLLRGGNSSAALTLLQSMRRPR